ncbi:MAG: DinB family protein [Acidobacteriota bacterium]
MARQQPENPSVSLLLRSLDQAFDRKSWHGTNLRGSLRGLGFDEAIWRPAPERHNIWELTVHASYWKYAVRRRVTGEKRGGFTVRGSNWFSRPDGLGEDDWRRELQLLSDEHHALRLAVSQLNDADLSRRSGEYDFAGLITGLVAHDLYHAGQIQLIKRLHADQA